MLFQDDEQLRKLYRHRVLLAEFAARENRYTMPYALGDIPPDFFESLQQLMDVNLDEKTKIRSTYGPMVGGVLMFMKQMSLSGSMSKKQAFKLHQAIAPERTPWNQMVPISDRGLREGWHMLASVAHLWSAEQWFHHVATILNEDSQFHALTLMNPETFPYFVTTANYFFAFGANTIATRGKTPILSRGDAWQIDIGESLPEPQEVIDHLFPRLGVEEGELVWPLQPEDLALISTKSR